MAKLGVRLMTSWLNARVNFHYFVASACVRLHCYEAAANAYERVLRIRPADRQAKFHRAWNLLSVPARRSEGIASFQRLLKASPSGSGYYLMACGLQQESRHEEAVEALGEALRMEGEGTADLYFNYGVSLDALGRLQEAADAYENAVHLSPSDGAAWGYLGAVYVQLARWKDAASCQERAIRLSPSHARALDLASTLYELNRLDEAERVLRQALVQDPRSIDATELLAQVLAGQDRYEEAIRLARGICAARPNAASARTVLAGVLMEAGQLDEALNETAAAMRIAPADPGPHCVTGAIYLNMRDGARALAAFECMAGCLQPDAAKVPLAPWVWLLAGRGAALSLLRRHTEAMAAFDELLRIDPTFFERWPEKAHEYQLSLQATRT